MSESVIPYKNNMLDFTGKLTRIAYILQNLFLNTIAFPFVYYPAILRALHAYPDFHTLLEILGTDPNYTPLVQHLSSNPKEGLLSLTIKYMLIIPFRMIDLKRIRDVLDRELKLIETVFIVVVFSLPYIDFFTTFFLTLIPPGQRSKELSDLNKSSRSPQ